MSAAPEPRHRVAHRPASAEDNTFETVRGQEVQDSVADAATLLVEHRACNPETPAQLK